MKLRLATILVNQKHTNKYDQIFIPSQPINIKKKLLAICNAMARTLAYGTSIVTYNST